MRLPRFGTFYAQQRFELIETSEEHREYAPSERYRVTTREYIYRVELEAGPEIRWHWHPDGNSPEHRPHIHLWFNLRAHLPGPRIVLEDVIEGCIELGARAACGDWKQRLAETGGLHKLYRTWVNEPTERRSRPGPANR
ncbi:hypothetical protein BMW24_022930 [Mycobacterium heckeshornense]|nr:hypothetical protein ACT16_15790 [Mycobacterium heckeshornense]MCV7032867.1 hypothetical protein [Mycobacterium heckeshornense]PIJ29474.1 hypothetical protein BMW24_022930 [Mycobacterium heckeshornense]